MLSNRLAAWLAQRNIHYGWVVAGVTFLTMLATAGAMGALGVMIKPLESEFGWRISDISSALAVRLVLFGVMGPFAAAFMNRFGVRNVITVAAVLICAGLGASFAMTQMWQLVLCWGVAVGLGTGITAMVLGATVATRWFTKRRGLVVGMLTASTATGQLVFLPLIASITEQHGWRTALTLSISMLLLAMLLVRALMRDQPADLGLMPYGETMPAAGIAAPTAAARAASRASLATMLKSPLLMLREASGNRVFWVLFATFFVCGLSTNGLIQTHWVTLCGDFGLAPVGAAGILAMIGVFDFIGTILSGWLSDRYDNRWLLFWYYGLRGLSLLFLPYTEFTLYGLSVFAVFYGLDWVATIPPTVRMTAETFGREKANLAFGWIFAGHQLGAAAAAYGAGASRTEFASYMPALYVAGGACLLASLLVISLSKRRPSALAPAAPA